MSMITSMMLIIYGIIIMSMLLDLHPNKLPPGKRGAAILYTFVIVAGNGLAMKLLGQPLYGKYYLFLVQIPLYTGFAIFSCYKGVKLFFVLLSIIVLAAPPIMCVTALRTFCQIDMATSLVVFFICYVLMIAFVYKILKPDFNYMLENCESRHFWLFCLIPILDYVYSFVRTGYNFVQHFSPEGYWIRQIPTMIVFASYILLVRVFRSTRENQQLQNETNMMQMQMEAARLRLNELKNAQEQAVIYRHDMRHHLSLLAGFVAEGDMQKIKNYLAGAEIDMDAVTPTHYCDNETINLILSFFDKQAKKEGVKLCTEVRLPNELSISDTELCTLLSNALENAITAAAQVEDETLRKVYIRALIHDGKLLISTENAYIGTIEMDGELPISKNTEAGHGFGVKSIVAITEHHHGLYSFEKENGVFALHLMLPLS
ncbi:MAG: ATP-binding protein [Lachnospiraceae bacterium]|nr:ATP-binding protein [Lachnospiraceae bacterium]